ncbi:MAG: MoaD/ThiS family protein [Vicinamibacteria bacterium]|nr:MoaD/ThiS family protein [Vicinamibacteria bacterium]
MRLFARLKDIAGAPELERDVPADATLADVWALLAHDFPAMAPYRGSVSGARNAEYSRMDAVIADGDEIAFLPPVSGG